MGDRGSMRVSIGGMSFYYHVGYTFPIYSRNGPIKICLKYVLYLSNVCEKTSRYYDFHTKTVYSSDGLRMHCKVELALIMWFNCI